MSKREENEEYYEDAEEKRLSIVKRIGITILVIIGIIIVFFMLKSCDNNNNENNGGNNVPNVETQKDLKEVLLAAGKEYYGINEYLMPTSTGDCKTVTSDKLIENGLIENELFNTCVGAKTYVKVCKLESGKFHFVAFLDCTNEKTEDKMGEWVEGKENELTKDTDVKFAFQVEYLDTQDSTFGPLQTYWRDEVPYQNYRTESITSYYRYKDLQYRWNITVNNYYPSNSLTALGVKEYFIKSPASGYTNKDSETLAYKYYKNTNVKEYYMINGKKQYSATAPNAEYPNKDETDTQIVNSKFEIRRWDENNKTTPTKMYRCAKEENEVLNEIIITSLKPCNVNTINPYYIYERGTFYTCNDGITEVSQNTACTCKTGHIKREIDPTSCGTYSAWEETSTDCTAGDSDLCRKTTSTLYSWFKYKREYYPSKSVVASGENKYYDSAPETGLIKDESTSAKAWKWYKKITTVTEEYYTLAPQSGATRTSDSRWTNYSQWSTTMPESLGSGGTRTVESKDKVTVREIKNASSEWIMLNSEYKELEEVLKLLQSKKYSVYSLDDITKNQELKYKIKMFIRNEEVE